MSSFFIHFIFFIFFAIFFVLVSIFSVYLSFYDFSFFVSINLFSFWFNDITLSFYFDLMSSWFSASILAISTIIMIYSHSYISPYQNTVYFLWLTTLFVLSMLIVVACCDLLFLMLGWDGLGLVSFFLIVFYQNQLSVTSGLFTLLINRLGDSFFITSLVFVTFVSCDLSLFGQELLPALTTFILVLTFMTNSAIFPFSPWLPAAMAAPTPISALVHSSTLVASGLFLMMRFHYVIYSFTFIAKLLLVLGVYTSLYAGINTFFENDMNNIIALSTLSHLGFICMAFSAGLLYFAFFHMISHAFFKSLLFMSMGDIMVSSSHSQDIRFLGTGASLTPLSCFIMFVCLFSLLGIQSLSGYFSNDLVLEIANFSYFSMFLCLVVFLNVFFTYYYTYSLFYYSFGKNNLPPLHIHHSVSLLHTLLLVSLALITIVSGFVFLSLVFKYVVFYSIPFYFNIMPLFLNFMFFLFLFLNNQTFLFLNNQTFLYFSNMAFLTNVISHVSTFLYFSAAHGLLKSCEDGAFYFILNGWFYSAYSFISVFLLNSSFKLSMVSIIFFIVVFLSFFMF